MGKVTLLFAGKNYDTDVQSVRENQIVIFDGPYNMWKIQCKLPPKTKAILPPP